MKPRTLLLNLALLTSIVCMPGSVAHAQDAHLTAPDPAQISFVNFDPAKDVFTMSGSRITSTDFSEVYGTPNFLPNYVHGTVIFENGKVYREGLLQLNLVTNQVQFLYNGKPLVFAEPVKSFTLIDTSGGKTRSAWFNSGYPDYGAHHPNNFYQVLAIGPKVQLLKFISKHTSEQYQNSSLSKVYFKTNEDLFIYDVNSEELHYISNSASSIEKALGPAAEALVHEPGKKKLTENEIIQVVEKYNKS